MGPKSLFRMSGNPITIRVLGPEDAFVLDRVKEGVFDNPIDPSRAWSFLATRVNVLAVALDGADVIGYAYGTTMLRVDKPTAFYVDEISVHPDYRKQGIGKKLLRRIEAEARDRGCESLWLATEGDNAEARGLYDALEGTVLEGVAVYDWPLD